MVVPKGPLEDLSKPDASKNKFQSHSSSSDRLHMFQAYSSLTTQGFKEQANCQRVTHISVTEFKLSFQSPNYEVFCIIHIHLRIEFPHEP